MDETFAKIFIDVFFEDLEFCLREVVNRTKDWFRAFFKMDVMIQRATVWRQLVRFVLGEDFCKVFVFLGNRQMISLSDFVDSGEIFEETGDFIDIEDVDFVV